MCNVEASNGIKITSHMVSKIKHKRCDKMIHIHSFIVDTLVTTDREEAFAMGSKYYSLEIPKKGNFLVVEVTAVYNPAHFYVTFPYGTNTINELHREENIAATSTDGKLYQINVCPGSDPEWTIENPKAPGSKALTSFDWIR